jgi:hypothetical protein
VAIDLLLGCRELRAIVCVGAAIAIPSDARDRTKNFRLSLQAIQKSKSAVVAPCARALRWRTAMADDVIYSLVRAQVHLEENPAGPLREHRYGVITALFVSAITDDHYGPGFVLWAANARRDSSRTG